MYIDYTYICIYICFKLNLITGISTSRIYLLKLDNGEVCNVSNDTNLN